jgi:hypothetical protein
MTIPDGATHLWQLDAIQLISASSIPANVYVAEDGITPYVAEDGVTFYVQES